MPYLLRDYIDKRVLPLSDTVEGTLNTILEDLIKQPRNVEAGHFRYELISACAVALNGLSKIKDPVMLFRNLGKAFEKRAYCIYTKTVVDAFNRLYSDAVRQGKEKEILSVWKSFTNHLTKAHSMKYLPTIELNGLVNSQNPHISKSAAETLVSRKETPPEEINTFLYSDDPNVRLGASEALIFRRDFSVERLKELLSHNDSSVRSGVAEALASHPNFSIVKVKILLARSNDPPVSLGLAKGLASRRDFSIKDITKLLSHSDPFIRSGIAMGLATRRDIPFVELRELSAYPDLNVRQNVDAILESRRKLPLKNISGKRKSRTDRIKAHTKQLRA